MTPKMLVVDDDENLRELYRLELEAEGYNVDPAADAYAAIEMLQHTCYDVIIVDARIPGMLGIDLLQKLIALNRHQPLILNTSYRYYRQNFLAWPASTCVVKSYSTNELKQAIKSKLEAKA